MKSKESSFKRHLTNFGACTFIKVMPINCLKYCQPVTRIKKIFTIRIMQVCDFGFALWKQFSESHSVNDVRTGTVTHVPPEYWNDSRLRKVEAFDVYGFGILIWEVATEEKPFSNG